ncbi:MAG TPA: hypothetical protein DHU96_26930 [Actinobacteria bacterium]|nr:hypothetical protein [Actinomycetota bacterium]
MSGTLGGQEPTGGATAGPAKARASGTPRAGASGARSAPAGTPRSRLEGRFEQVLSLSRIVIVVPVIILLLASLASFAYGTYVFARSVADIVDDPHVTSKNLGFLLLLTDLFLVGATLMIAAFGLYELFISRIDTEGAGMRLPGWLKMNDLNDLKARVISMIILVAAVSFVDVVVEFKGGLDTFYLGVAVAVVIAALTVFLRFGRPESGDR